MIRIRSRMTGIIFSRVLLLSRWRESLFLLSILLIPTTSCSPSSAGVPEWTVHCIAHSVVPALLAYVRMPVSTDIRTGTTLGAVSVFQENWMSRLWTPESGVTERAGSASSAYPEHVVRTDISFAVVVASLSVSSWRGPGLDG